MTAPIIDLTAEEAASWNSSEFYDENDENQSAYYRACVRKTHKLLISPFPINPLMTWDNYKSMNSAEANLTAKFNLASHIWSTAENVAFECAICTKHFDIGDNVTTLSCFHMFHQSDINAWLSISPTCPLCRHQIKQ